MLVASLFTTVAFADPSVVIKNRPFGSGTPGVDGVTETQPVGDNLYHVPQALPGVPTAATLYPRVVDVECVKAKTGTVVCDGYNWLPSLGRGEYILIRPVIKEPAAPTIVYKEVKKKKE
jgi:hypothetical protein